MGPRKRSKPNPKAETASDREPQQQSSSPPTPNQEQVKNSPVRTTGGSDISETAKETNDGGASIPRSSKSWYSGTWPHGSKATPVTQVAKESISAAAGVTSEVVASARAHTPPLPTTPLKGSPAFQRLGSSSRSLPLAATTTKLNISSNTPVPAKVDSKGGNDRDGDALECEGEKYDASKEADTKAAKAVEGNPKGLPPINGPVSPASEGMVTEGTKSTGEPSGWLTWFSKAEQAKNFPQTVPSNKLRGTDDGVPTKNRPERTIIGVSKPDEVISAKRRNSEREVSVHIDAVQDEPRSWLNLWGNISTQAKPGVISTTAGTPENVNGELESPTLESKKMGQVNGNAMAIESHLESDLGEQGKTSGWAFWSRDTSNKKSDDSTGELALAGSPSQTHPEKDTVDNIKGVPKKIGKRQTPQSSDADADDMARLIKTPIENKKTETSDAPAVSTKDKAMTDAMVNLKQGPANLLLPSFKSTYASASKPGLIQQLSHWLPFASSFTQPKHLNITVNPPRIKKALAIGVHGFFPAPLVRSFLGQPTGTSIRFANSAASAIQKWTQAQGYSCEVEKVALEGEGKIADRIDLLWKLMLNWIDKISKSDFVFVACHSQGCPVALMLVAKLIAFGCVSSARIGICAMAGINLGPFIDFKSRWIGGTALELFDFAKQESKVSKDYESALDTALRFGVKIVYVGSIDDQLVSLEVRKDSVCPLLRRFDRI